MSVREMATSLIARHGRGARQKVIDEVVAAVRAHDIELAKRWDEVGRAVDEQLGLAR